MRSGVVEIKQASTEMLSLTLWPSRSSQINAVFCRTNSCMEDAFCACAYVQGLGTPDMPS